MGSLGPREVATDEATNSAGSGERVATAAHGDGAVTEMLLQQPAQFLLREPPELAVLGIAHGDIRHRRQQHTARLQNSPELGHHPVDIEHQVEDERADDAVDSLSPSRCRKPNFATLARPDYSGAGLSTGRGRSSVVREGGVEPPRAFAHWILSPARLPVSPLSHHRVSDSSDYILRGMPRLRSSHRTGQVSC
jgi:hypothetical protein